MIASSRGQVEYSNAHARSDFSYWFHPCADGDTGDNLILSNRFNVLKATF